MAQKQPTPQQPSNPKVTYLILQNNQVIDTIQAFRASRAIKYLQNNHPGCRLALLIPLDEEQHHEDSGHR